MRRGLLTLSLLLIGCDGREAAAPAARASEAEAEPRAASGGETVAGPLALAPEGVIHVAANGEPAEPLAFGAARTIVEGLIGRSAGAPPRRARNEECGAGPIDTTEYGPLTLNFQDDRFVGWFAAEGTTIPTIDGILPGATRAELEAERPFELLQDSTLDGEFSYALPGGGEIGGFLDGAGPEARVTALYAGTNCFFR